MLKEASKIMDPLSWPVYALPRLEKSHLLIAELNRLTHMHDQRCAAYRRWLCSRGVKATAVFDRETLPFFPVRLFKSHHLSSVQDSDVYRVLLSSGTTGHAPSKIFLDSETAILQSRGLVRIMQHYIGKNRLPMLVIDEPSVVRSRGGQVARTAAVLGMSQFGRHCSFALNPDLSINQEALQRFCIEFAGMPKFVFGFTFIVWKYFIESLIRQGITLDLSGAVLFHGGGWKKLATEKISPSEFRSAVLRCCRIDRVHDYYGMVEQTGSIFVECEFGQYHTPVYSDVVIRNPQTWDPCKPGEVGLIQVLSSFPRSYPGHSLLTEDLGALTGEDSCQCGRLGRTFQVFGRLPQAEPRGCSDTRTL